MPKYLTTHSDEVYSIIHSAQDAIKRDDRITALRLAERVASLVPVTEAPWLILAALASPEESLPLIRKELQINPHNEPARRSLEWALKRQYEKPIIPVPDVPEQVPYPIKPAVLKHSSGYSVHPSLAIEDHKIVSIPGVRRQISGPVTFAFPKRPSESVVHPPLEIEEHKEVSIPEVPKQIPSPGPSVVPDRPAEHVAPPSLVIEKQKKAPISFSRVLRFILSELALVAIILGFVYLRPQLTGLWVQLFPVRCHSSLVLDTRSFEVRKIRIRSDGTLHVPRGHPDRAYWVEGTETNLVFALYPGSENHSLLYTLGSYSTAVFTWANCNTATYRLSSPLQELPDNPTLLDQSTSQITIFIPAGTDSGGLAVRGELMEESITSFDTPDASAVQAEISLLQTTASLDQGTIMAGASVYNYGQKAITLTAEDFSLIPEASDPLVPDSISPPQPITIEPGTTATIQLTFPRPSTPTAILKILTVEYILEGY